MASNISDDTIPCPLGRAELCILLVGTVSPTKMFSSNAMLNEALKRGYWDSQTYRLEPLCFENLTLRDMWMIYNTNKKELAIEATKTEQATIKTEAIH